MMHPKNKVEPVSDSVSGKTQLVPNGNPEIKTDAASRTTTPLAFSDVAERVHSDRRLERNTVVWKDTNGHIFTTLSSESNIEVECSDVLDGFNFDRPELILRILGNAEHNTTSYDYREIPELEYCVSYTGKGGVHLLPVPLRRRLIQLVHEIGAWIVSEYEGKDILESTNQPYVMPDQLKPKFSPESSIWPPTLGYSSVYLANAPRSHELKPKLQSSNDPFECVLLANGNVHSLERMLSTLDFSKANILVIKGSGGLADALANSVSGETSNFSLDTVLSALGIRWSTHKTYTDCYVVEDDVEMSDDDFEMFEDDSNVTGSKATIYHQEKFTINDEGQTTLNTTILENLYDGQNHLTVSKGMGAPRVTFPQDFVGPSYAQNSVRSEMVISVKNFEKLCAKVTIFEADLTLPDYGLGKAILQCVLRGQPERNIKLLRLCLDLDCFGEAETYIFPKGYQSIDPSPIVQTAFMKKRLKFLEYFLRTGVFDALQDDEYAMNSIVTDSRALSFIDKTLWHEKKVNHKDFFSINDHLFRQCLMSKNFDMIDISQLFWFKTKDPLGTLLLANIYLTKVAKKEKNHLKRAQIKATAIEYQGLAVSFVNACFDKDPETTIKMITHKMDQFDEKSCIDLAMESSNLDFLVQPACITVQRRVWRWGNLYDFYKENENVSKTLFSPSTASKREKIGHKTLWRRYYMLLCVPKTMFTLNGLGLIIFIYMFGLTLLGRLEQYKFHWLEAVLLSNVMVGLCEEIYEGRIIGKEAYFKSGWNIADLTSIALFLASAGCRIVSYFFTGNFLFEVSRVSLALDFIIFTLRLLHNCYSSPELGPTCAMMIKTIKLLTRYLYLLLLVWASYAIASESVLYPNSVLSFYTFYYLFRKAYWQMFGELFLDELEAGKASDPNALECTNNVSLYATYQMLRCPSTFGRYVAPVLLAVYIMFTYVLLFSLITASFTKSIEKIQQKAYKLWRFQFFELTRSFSKVMFLPLPFTVISIGAVVCDEERRDEDGFSISDSRIKKVLQQIKETKKKLYDRLPTSKLNGSLQDSDMACCLAGISNKFKVIKKCVKHPHKENSSEERDSAFSDLKEMIYNYGTYLKKTELIKGLEETVDRIEEPNSPVDETHISNLKTFITEYGSSVSKHLHRANTHKRTELKLKYTFTEIKVLESDFPAVQPIVSNLRVNISCIERLHFIEEMKKCIFEIEKQNTIDTKGNQIQKQLMKKWNPIAGKDNKIHILFKELLDLSEKLEELNLGASRNDSVKQERTTLREIRRRLLDLQKALYKIPISSQSRLEVKDMLGSSTREKIRGLLTAINYYWQISCDCKMLQPLDDLEKLMLQNPFDDEYCQMRAKIKDLESFILQSHIEPMLQMKRNSSKPDSVKEKTIETSTNISPITEYGHKVAPRVPGKTESARPQNAAEDDIEDAHYTHWVPIQSDHDYVTRLKDAKPSKDEPQEPKTLKFNRYDHIYRVERRSYLGRYEVKGDNFPINPYSDSETPEEQLSIELPRWGPNHFGIPVITRVKFESKEKKIAKKDNKSVLEFLVETTDDGKYHFPKVNISPSRDLFITYIKIKERETADLKRNAGSNPTPRPPKPEKSTMKSKQRWRVPFMIKKAFPKSQSQENDRKKKQTQMHMKPNDQIQMRSCQKTKTIFIGLAESETMMTKHKWAEFRIINYHNPNTHYQHVIDALINEPLSNLRWIDYSAYSLVENFTGKDIFAFVCGHRGCYFEKRPGTAGRSARPRTAKVGFPKGISEPGTSAQGISEPLTSAPGVPERGTSAQGISEPGISAKDISEPMTSAQSISEPGISAQDISEPVTSDQGISEPRISAHGISKQGTSSQGKYDQDTPAQGKSEQA